MSYYMNKLMIDIYTDAWMETNTLTETGNDDTRQPKLALGKNDNTLITYSLINEA